MEVNLENTMGSDLSNNERINLHARHKPLLQVSARLSTGVMSKVIDQVLSAKNGSKIHIKKSNKGKFTASAKRAGKSVQQHANSVLHDPNATPLQRKRANFARNAAKWNH